MQAPINYRGPQTWPTFEGFLMKKVVGRPTWQPDEMLPEFIEDEFECFSLRHAPIFLLLRTVLLFFHFYSDHQMSIKCNYLLVKYWLVLRNPLVADSYIISQLFLSTALTSITRNIVHTNFSLSSPVNYEKCAHSIHVKKEFEKQVCNYRKTGHWH